MEPALSRIDPVANPAHALPALRDSAAAEATGAAQALTSWLFTDHKLSLGHLEGMQFYDFVGPEHLKKFLRYIRNFEYPDYLDRAAVAALTEQSIGDYVFDKRIAR